MPVLPRAGDASSPRYAGFSLGKADMLRRAMGEKECCRDAPNGGEFLSKAPSKRARTKQAQEAFAVMEKFVGYGFNRSHAYAYAAFSFQLALL